METMPVSSETTTATASDSSVIAEARPVPQAEIPVEILPLAHREDGGRASIRSLRMMRPPSCSGVFGWKM